MNIKIRLSILAAALAATLAVVPALATTIDPSNYDHNMSISPAAGRIATTLSNFPLLVRLSSTRQPWFNPADCGTGGADLRFALADGTLLAHEIDTWNPSGESFVWVNVPSLSPVTEIKVYWGVKNASLAPAVNAADTWPDYVAVYHLGEGDKIAYDSSANGYSATNAAAVSLGSSPKVGGCANIHDLYVTGVTNLLDPNAVKPLSNRSSITFSAWVAIDNFNTGEDAQNARVEIARKFNGVAADRHKGGFSCRYFANLNYPPKNNNPVFGIFLDDSTGISSTVENWNTQNAPASDGSWLYLTCTINDTTVAKYINGALLMDSDGKGNPRNLSHGILGPDVLPLEFGAADKTAPCQTYARMDEMRIRDGAVSAAWAAADYAQQNDASFLVYGEPPDKKFFVAQIPEQIVSSLAEVLVGIEPSVTVSNLEEGVQLVLGTDYTVSYVDNASLGTASAIVTGINGYDGYESVVAFSISLPGITAYYMLDGKDPTDASSISGAGSSTGWSTGKDSGVRSIAGITAQNAIYFIRGDRWCRSQPGGANYATPSSTTIVIEPSSVWTIADKQKTNTLTLSNLVVSAGGKLVVSPVSDGANFDNTYAGNYTLGEGASVEISATVFNNSRKQCILRATVSGRGEIVMPTMLREAGYTGALLNQIAGDISGFTGDLKTWNGLSNAYTLELVDAVSVPGDPAPSEVAYVVVTNSATLKIDQNWVSPTNRIWVLGDAGRPTIEVPSGTTVEINGDLVGSVGFVKTGDGMLVLRGASEAFAGEITISAGTLRLAGQATRLNGAAGVTITEAGGTFSVAGFYVPAIPAQTVYSLDALAAGVEPTVVVSNLDEGVELVLGTHYTLAYLNNTACGIATVVVTGINDYEGNVKEAAFAINSVRRVTASYNLAADEDWTDYESVEVFSKGVTIDLKGHKMTVTGLSGAGHITDSVGGGELIFDVPAAYASGYVARIDTVSLEGQLKLVKTGPGLLICSKTLQEYTGGTDILGGILRTAITPGNTMDNGKPLGPNTSSAHNRVYLGPNGILDPASIAGWSYHDLTIDGGMISNTVANTQLPNQARCFNPCFTVNADFTFATTEQYGLQLREFGGHTVTVSIAPNKVLYLMTGAPLPTSGRINIVSGGKIGTLSSYPPDFSTVDFVDCNAALTLIGAMSVHDYKPCNTETAGGGSAALSVYGTFTPDSDYFYGPVMQNGSAIDLSAKTGAWSVTSSLTSGNKTTTFASGATIKLELGERSFAKGERVISWTTQPDATFTNKAWNLESRDDGLYVVNRVGTGTVIYIH
ncbi:MAG: DUF2341 domain-containing protein [Kiritimatiellae bacterium]|nr:DUF2341 domain-containing protein [Kiritimatiellia bacterium]